MEKKRGLGRGLSALMDEIRSSPSESAQPFDGTSPQPQPQTLPVSKIRPMPGQPRRRFDPEAQGDLVESVRSRGVLQPILVRPRNDGYEIVAGERRWRAAQAAQVHDIPVIVRELDDSDAYEIALVENIQRADLNPIEEAEGYARLIHDFDHSQEELAKLVGKSRSHIANLLRLLDLPASVRDMLIDGKLSMGHARAIAAGPDPAALAEDVVARGLSVRQAEALAASARGRPSVRQASRTSRGPEKDADIRALEQMLSEVVGLAVSIEANAVRIDYKSLDQLDMVCQRLAGERF